MASYKGHLAFSASLGFVYGGLARSQLDFDPATAILGAGLTTVGGLMPDLDSDSGVPVRELFSLAAVLVPLLLWRRLIDAHLSDEEMLVFLGGTYATIRFGLSKLFKHLSVHRGMYHSVPAMLIAGLIVYLSYHSPSPRNRLFLAAGVMIGFLSHLVLDELCSVDFQGLTVKLNKYAGSAVKFISPSVIGTATCYLILLGLSYLAVLDYEKQTGTWVLPSEMHINWKK
jgi:membrane-bound metal-dependent hydrolase YbcI (DUF457 family)